MKMAKEMKMAASGKEAKEKAERLQAEWVNVAACSALAPRRSHAQYANRRAAANEEWPGPGRCIA
jgi:hypothetical protein